MRNLLTAVAAVVIIGAAGAAYYMSRDSAPSSPGSTTATPSATTTVTGSTSGATSSSTATSESTPSAGATVEPTNPQTALRSDQPAIGADEHVLGKAEAPITVIEYASMTCPHCAAFNQETMPRIKSEFVDKGLVRFVFRPFPLDRLAATASLLAQCVPGEGYFSMIDVLFRSQNEWGRATDQLAALKQIGRTAGLSNEAIDGCIADQAVIDRMVAGMQEAQTKFSIDSTPSFVINGKTYTNMPFDDYESDGATKPGFGKVLKDLLPKS